MNCVSNMLAENHHLNHENPDNYGTKIKLGKPDAQNDWYRQKNVPGNNGSKGDQGRFSTGFSDFQRKNLTHYNEVQYTEKSPQNQAFSDRTLTRDYQNKSCYNCGCHGPGTIFFLCLSYGVHFSVSLSES